LSEPARACWLRDTGSATAVDAWRAYQESAEGMAWWNSLPEVRRQTWMLIAGSSVPADAWRAYQRALSPLDK
jgi:hypothetical protein